MKTTQNTVLITGGSAGIGLAIAKELIQRDNEVIITGRDKERLRRAAAELGGKVTPIVSDVSRAEDVESLTQRIRQDFPDLNVLVNNAGKAYAYQPGEWVDAAERAAREVQTNFVSVVDLIERLLPLLKRQPEAAIVNVTSTLAFVPSVLTPTYSATKAALHSFSQVLRLTLHRDTAVRLFELMPPLVNTELSREIGGASGIAPEVVAEKLLEGLDNDIYEIRVGRTEELYKLFLSSPEQALLGLNKDRLAFRPA